jgi:hypothetical protein
MSCFLTVAALVAPFASRSVLAHESAPQAAPAAPIGEGTAASSSGRVADDHAFWTGLRFGGFIPYGGLYAERSLVTTPFQHVATGGPAIELDVGVRFGRCFVGYGFFEHVWLGRGTSPAWTTPHDGQVGAAMQAAGIGLRWISDPARFGLVADVGLSYRWFSANWADETKVRMHGFGDVRVGGGASVRVARHVSLVPLLTVYTGAFSQRSLDGQPLGQSASSYIATALTLGGYLDL